MITAKEAREKAENSIIEKTKEQLLMAQHGIEEAVKNGETKCWIGAHLGEQAIRKLRNLGYEIENNSDQRDGPIFWIRW